MMWLIIVPITLILLLYSPLKKYYKSKYIIRERKKISKRNSAFVHSRLKYIIEYFENDTILILTVNYKNNKIVGFFISVKECTDLFNTLTFSKEPTTSYELDIDEFCEFLNMYNSCVYDRQGVIKGIMREHLERLK